MGAEVEQRSNLVFMFYQMFCQCKSIENEN